MRRREFISLAGGAAIVSPLTKQAQTARAVGSDIKAAQAIAEFIVSFDLKNVPPIVVDRARVAFIDTVGVMLSGSQHHPADIVCEMIKSEGSGPAATIVGRSLRASPLCNALVALEADRVSTGSSAAFPFLRSEQHDQDGRL